MLGKYCFNELFWDVKLYIIHISNIQETEFSLVIYPYWVLPVAAKGSNISKFLTA